MSIDLALVAGGQGDEVADADAALAEQDQAGDQVVDHGLQAEADADRERAEDDREVAERHADHAQSSHDAERQDQPAQQAGDGEHRAAIERAVLRGEAQQQSLQRPPSQIASTSTRASSTSAQAETGWPTTVNSVPSNACRANWARPAGSGVVLTGGYACGPA